MSTSFHPVYTFDGLPDGSHLWPFSKFLSNTTERIQCCVSAAVSAIFSYAMAPPSTQTTETIVTQHHQAKVQNRTAEKPKRRLPTFEEIRNAIPKECFEKNLATSLFYFLLDCVIITGLYTIVPYVEYYGGWVGLFAWYWIMGIFMSSMFIIGHDCGHTTFSNYRIVNDIVGHLAHGSIMAPYWPWQKSHRQHHQYTSHLEKDRGHPWITENDHKTGSWLAKNFSKIPISGFLRWNPVYTFVGLPDGSHFWPFSKLFTNTTERIQCCVSAAVCAIFSYAAFVLCDYSVWGFLKYYYVPLLFQSFWMVMITYLQHQDEEIEVYEEGTWNFVTGQSQTIDRYYGFGIDTALHHITDGHVAHHFFFTKIPHYHLPAATKAIRRVMSAYPGAYKRRACYNHAFEFLRLNVKLEYLIGKGTGLLKYNSSRDFKSIEPNKSE